MHPTRQKLIDTVLELAGQNPLETLNVEQVLSTADVSRGSLYHHFEDFFHLLEAAEAVRFASYVDLTISKMKAMFDAAANTEELMIGLRKTTRATQNPDVAWMRRLRILALARAYESERFRETLAAEQQRLNDSLTDLIRAAQLRGLITSEVDPHASAVFIQAYTIGRAIDDIVEHPVDGDAWFEMVDRFAERTYTE